MCSYFEKIHDILPAIKQFNTNSPHEDFYKEEVIRFYSIAGTIRENFLDAPNNIDARIISHVLIRSVIENYFWLLYIYFDDSLIKNRFDEYLNGFKKEYLKLHNEPLLPDKHMLETPDDSWKTLSHKDLNSILTALVNDHGNKLNYIYFVYRISSFDTHGKSLSALFRTSFNKDCNFPYIKLEPIIDLIANQYLVIWDKISLNHNSPKA